MTNEKLVINAINKYYNDEIGSNENSYLDGEEYHAWKEQELIDYIVTDMFQREYLELENSFDVLEAKHVRFLGEQQVRALVTGVVHGRHNSEEPWIWEKNKKAH